jgi:hypothetical protein
MRRIVSQATIDGATRSRLWSSLASPPDRCAGHCTRKCVRCRAVEGESSGGRRQRPGGSVGRRLTSPNAPRAEHRQVGSGGGGLDDASLAALLDASDDRLSRGWAGGVLLGGSFDAGAGGWVVEAPRVARQRGAAGAAGPRAAKRGGRVRPDRRIASTIAREVERVARAARVQ